MSDGDWADALRRTAHAFRELTLAHPHVVPLLVTRPLAAPLALRPLGTLHPLERILALLTAAGFTPLRRCGPTARTSASCKAISSPSCRKSSPTPKRPTTCCAWACTGCHRASSPTCGPWPANWLATTAPPNSSRPRHPADRFRPGPARPSPGQRR
ncbi:MAG: TetR/AcrR family transcriptional regulator C-terminal domain-containing protein [Dermatophilaceae bacterium]